MLIQRPIITEKSLGLAGRGLYTFAVAFSVRKEQAAAEIKRMYHVDVIAVRSVTMHGKVRRVGKKMIHEKKVDWKKMIVSLKPGQHIDVFEAVQKELEEKKKEKPAVAKTKAGK